ncbi:hypothetical protein ACM66B_004522 [Microbotryomycetes sp. NB124-2]
MATGIGSASRQESSLADARKAVSELSVHAHTFVTESKINALVDGQATKSLVAAARAVFRVVEAAGGADNLPHECKKTLDEAASSLWNHSKDILLPRARASDIANCQNQAVVRSVAQVKLIAFKIACLCASGPQARAHHADLLSLGNSLCCRLLQEQLLSQAEEAFSLVGEHVNSLETVLDSSEAALIACHRLLRLGQAVKKRKESLAKWLLEQFELSLAQLKDDAGAKLQVGAMCYEIGVMALPDYPDLASSLFDQGFGLCGEQQAGTTIKTALLKGSAQACLLVSPPNIDRAQATLNQVLRLEGSPDLWRLSVRLIIATTSNNETAILQAFTNAAKHGLDEQSAPSRPAIPGRRLTTASRRLVHLVYELHASKRSTAFAVLRALVKEASVYSSRAPNAAEESEAVALNLATILNTAINLTDSCATLSLLEELLTDVTSAFALSRDDAFLCTVQLWHLGDKAVKNKDYAFASSCFLLVTKPVFQASATESWSKSLRKAAVCLLEAQQINDAIEVIDRARKIETGTEGSEVAFLQYKVALMQQDFSKAFDALIVIASGANGLKLLSWCVTAVIEHSQQGVWQRGMLLDVMRQLAVEIHRKAKVISGAESADILGVARSVVRGLLTVTAAEERASGEDPLGNADFLAKCLKSACQVCRALASQTHRDAATLAQGFAWLHETSYNVSVKARKCPLPHHCIATLFKTTADLIDLELAVGWRHVQELKSRAISCRLAAAASEMEHLKMVTHGVLEDEAAQFIATLLERVKQDLHHVREPLVGVAEAVLALEVETACISDDDKALASIFGDSSRFEALSVDVVKHLTRYVLDNRREVSQGVLVALESCFKVLFTRRKLDTPKLASWLRLMVHCQLNSQPEQAFAYVKSAVGFVSGSSHYPPEEAEWLAAASWNKGLEYFAASQIDSGLEWCGAALDICQAGSLNSTSQVKQDLDTLRKQFSHESQSQDDSMDVI